MLQVMPTRALPSLQSFLPLSLSVYLLSVVVLVPTTALPPPPSLFSCENVFVAQAMAADGSLTSSLLLQFIPSPKFWNNQFLASYPLLFVRMKTSYRYEYYLFPTHTKCRAHCQAHCKSEKKISAEYPLLLQ